MNSLAQKLRANSTPAERRLWRLLYPFRTDGFHFRKQVALGPYVVDFACLHAGVVIEVDGDSHFSTAGEAADRVRDAYLRSRELTVLRFSNHEVLTNSAGVHLTIEAVLRTRERNRRSNSRGA